MKANQFGDYQLIDINRLFIDHCYQRIIKPTVIKGMVEDFDASLIGTLMVVIRKNGNFAVVDGQHRLSVLKSLGYKMIPCLVYPETITKVEIEKFRKLNQNKNKLNALEDFWAAVGIGDKDSVAILGVIEKNGLTVSKAASNRAHQNQSIGAIGVVRRIVKEHKLDILDKTLNFITNVWPANGEALTGQLMEGIAIFTKRHSSNPVYNDENARKKLMDITISLVLAKARNQAKLYGTHISYVISDVLCEAYNKRLSKDKKLAWQSMGSTQAIGG